MRHYLLLLLAWFVLSPAAGAFAGSSGTGAETEISLEDIDGAPLNLQGLNPMRLPGKSYDDRAHQTIITGYAVTSYKYNDNGVERDMGNELHFAQDAPETSNFGFDILGVGFTKRFSDWAWVGAAMEVGIHSGHDGGTETEVELDVGEVHLVAPVGNGLDIAIGKFNSPVSFEQEDAPLLLQTSHSLAYQFASPAKMVGVIATYPVWENLDFRGGVFNGWDSYAGDGDNNDAKSFFLQMGFAPASWLDTKLSFIHGAEMDENADDVRTVIDAVATVTPCPGCILGLEFAYGMDENQSLRHPGEDAHWLSGQATAHYDWTQWLGTTVRYSFFHDPDGNPDLFREEEEEMREEEEEHGEEDDVFRPMGTRTWHEVTVAQVFHLAPDFLGYMGFGVIPRTQHLLSGIDLRFEYRHDWIEGPGGHRIFVNDKGHSKGFRNSFFAEVVASF